MSREPRTERHLSLAWADKLSAAIDAELRHEAGSLHDPGTESVLGQVFAARTRHHTGHPATPQEPAMPPPLPHMPPRPEGLAHLPAALTRPGTKPAPIPFSSPGNPDGSGTAEPARPPGARATEPSESTRRRWARMAEVESAARQAAHADGVREGWRGGWRWGLVCGLIAGALVASVGLGLWLELQHPAAAADLRPAAQPPRV